MTIAVRTDGVLQWILPDHIGSTSTTANADGTLNSVIQYTAFGEIRSTQGITPTKYRYTGQLAQAELGLDYYLARWYDPVLGHFTQADTLIPEPGKSSAFDRYAYVRNNPIIFSDPTGNKACEEDDDCRKTKSTKDRVKGYKSKLKEYYDIEIVGDNWELAELLPVVIGIISMDKGIDKITNGEGANWIKKNLGGIKIDIGFTGSDLLNANFADNETIHVLNDFEKLGKGNYVESSENNMIVHEIGHTWDNKMLGEKGFSQAIWQGHGPSDQLMNFVGGESTSLVRWQNDSLDIDRKMIFKDVNGYGYGNNSTVDYFAHSFTSSVISPNSQNAPQSAIQWVSALIYLTK